MKGRESGNGRDLYPGIDPYRKGRMAVGEGHTLYWEESGNPNGHPVLFLHGGPGAGASSDHRRFFDPKHYRIVIFDQRGAGRSEPAGSVEDNTTAHLIADIEQLRQERGIETWHVFGGSWGSTLALAYAQSHPRAVRSLILRGIFLCRDQEVDWFLHGMSTFFPEQWRSFVEHLPAAEQGDLLGSYYKRLTDSDPAVHLPAAKIWSRYESACSTLLPSNDSLTPFSNPRTALSVARIEAHYFVHKGFLEDRPLLEAIDAIRHIPAVIVQGRYDVVCPPTSAHDLHEAWPEAELQIIPDAGHSAMEPGIRRALIAAADKFRALDA